MTMRVGVPRGLLYHEYAPAIHTFLESCGAETVVSPQTNREILEKGLALCVDDACLPVKAFFGHAAVLSDQVDALFVARFVSVERGAYICPKFMGLPDMIRARLQNAPPIIDMCVDIRQGLGSYVSSLPCSDTCKILGVAPRRLSWALGAALMAQRKEDRRRVKRFAPSGSAVARTGLGGYTRESIYETSLTIGVLGHTYNLDDAYLSLGLISKLEKMGVKAVTAEDYAYDNLRRWERRGADRKQVFWTAGRKLIGAARRWRETGEVDGMVHLTSFGCGPESFVAEVIARDAARHPAMPLIILNVDEHSGEAGMATRLEAFVDTVRMGKSKR